jgi:CheY-like chemotaxis protein
MDVHRMTGPSNAQPYGLDVLVVDDNHDSAEMLQVLLGMLGHTVSVAHTGRSAIESITAACPHVVLLDIGLPDMSGYDVAREIRALGATPARLIALTGWGPDEVADQAADAGFDQYLTKPADPALLEQILSNVAASIVR